MNKRLSNMYKIIKNICVARTKFVNRIRAEMISFGKKLVLRFKACAKIKFKNRFYHKRSFTARNSDNIILDAAKMMQDSFDAANKELNQLIGEKYE